MTLCFKLKKTNGEKHGANGYITETNLTVDENGDSREKLTSLHFPLEEDLLQKGWI